MLTRRLLAGILTVLLGLLAGPGHAAPAPAKGALPLAAAAAAPQLVCLAGTILSAAGRPCPGVCVFPLSNHHLVAVTDARGAFQLLVPAAATLWLQAEYLGLGYVRLAVDTQHPQPMHIVLGRR